MISQEKKKAPLILPSLLSASFDCLGPVLRSLEDAGVTVFHFDVMDGHFVPNLSGSPSIVKSLQSHVRGQFDVHLMVDNPETVIPWFDFISVRSISIHVEASKDLAADFASIRSRGKKAGIVINPPTPIRALEPYFAQADQILVMTVNPGHGGQSLIEETLEKIEYCAHRRNQLGLSFTIQVDGGVNEATIGRVYNAGADEIVAGSAIFDRDNPIEAYRNMNRLIGNVDCDCY